MRKSFFFLIFIFSFAFILKADYVILKLENVHCEKGAKVVEKALLSIDGVEEVKIEIDKKVCHVKYDANKTKPEALLEAVNKTNYKAEIEGKHSCPSLGIKEIDDFHHILHYMHEGIDEKNYNILKENMPEMLKKRDALKVYFENLLSSAKGKEDEKKCIEMMELFNVVSKNVDSLKNSLKNEKEDEIIKSFEELHENFYKILNKSKKK